MRNLVIQKSRDEINNILKSISAINDDFCIIYLSNREAVIIFAKEYISEGFHKLADVSWKEFDWHKIQAFKNPVSVVSIQGNPNLKPF